MIDPAEPTEPSDPDTPLGEPEDVRALGENRYIISLESDGDEDDAVGSDAPASSNSRPESLGDAAYGFEVTIASEHGITRETAASNDVRETFDALVRAYARAVAPDRSPEEVVRTLLAARRS